MTRYVVFTTRTEIPFDRKTRTTFQTRNPDGEKNRVLAPYMVSIRVSVASTAAGDIVAVELTHIPASAATVVTVRSIKNWLNNLRKLTERNDDGHCHFLLNTRARRILNTAAVYLTTTSMCNMYSQSRTALLLFPSKVNTESEKENVRKPRARNRLNQFTRDYIIE